MRDDCMHIQLNPCVRFVLCKTTAPASPLYCLLLMMMVGRMVTSPRPPLPTCQSVKGPGITTHAYYDRPAPFLQLSILCTMTFQAEKHTCHSPPASTDPYTPSSTGVRWLRMEDGKHFPLRTAHHTLHPEKTTQPQPCCARSLLPAAYSYSRVSGASLVFDSERGEGCYLCCLLCLEDRVVLILLRIAYARPDLAHIHT